MSEPAPQLGTFLRKIWVVGAGILCSALVGYGAGTWIARKQEVLYTKLEQAEQALRQLRNDHANLKKEKDALQQAYTELNRAFDGIKAERDRFASQAQSAQEELKTKFLSLTQDKERLGAELERMAKENKELELKVRVLEERLASMEKAHQEIRFERDTLQRQLSLARDFDRENVLKRQLLDKEKQIRQKEDALKQAVRQQEALRKELEKRQADLEKVEGRLKQLQAEHIRLVEESKRLREQVDKSPGQVTRLAKQHERLIRETADMHYNLGILFSKQKEYARATQEFKKVLELRPDDADAHYNLGVIYAEHLPDRKRAMEHFRMYLKLNPRAQDASWVKQYIASWQAWEGKERLD
jgi:chromosome segregation ATPase